VLRSLADAPAARREEQLKELSRAVEELAGRKVVVLPPAEQGKGDALERFWREVQRLQGESPGLRVRISYFDRTPFQGSSSICLQGDSPSISALQSSILTPRRLWCHNG